MRDDVTGDDCIFLQRFSLPSQNVWPILNKALIFKEPRWPARATLICWIVSRLDRALPVRHRMRRIWNVAIGLRLGSRGRIEWKLSIGMKVKVPLRDVGPRWPGIEWRPTVRAGLERNRFRLFELAFIFQIISEPGTQNVRPKVLTRGAAEIDVAQLVTGGTIPTAVVPRPGNQIIHVVRVSLL